MLSVLFGYRVVAGDFSWANLVLEAVLLAISIKILLIGEPLAQEGRSKGAKE